MNTQRAVTSSTSVFTVEMADDGVCCSHQWCLVNEGGQSDVTLGQPPTVMCAESDLDLGEQREGNTVSMTLIIRLQQAHFSQVNLSLFALAKGWRFSAHQRASSLKSANFIMASSTLAFPLTYSKDEKDGRKSNIYPYLHLQQTGV